MANLTGSEKEILNFLKLNNVEIRKQALMIVRGLASDDDGSKIFTKDNFYAVKLLRDVVMDANVDVESSCLAFDSLINSTSTNDDVVDFIVDDEHFLKFLLNDQVVDDDDDERKIALKRSMLLSNVTRRFAGCEALTSVTSNFYKILSRFCDSLNLDDEIANYNSFIIRNCSQLRTIRDQILTTDDDDDDEDRPALIYKLFHLTDLRFPTLRRDAAVDVLRNCCFDSENHSKLVSFGHDLVCSLLLPLAGPEEFDDEDNDKLPTDLQYLQSNKLREPDARIRIKILEALYQLCATTIGREFLRNAGAYLILREYHKWETNDDADFICGDVVNCLIRTEGEIGCDDLRKLNVDDDDEKEKSIK
jgi:hemin uptake protein HemP